MLPGLAIRGDLTVESEELDRTPQPMLSVFEDRYGVGASARLRALFAQPCMTFAAIAHEFGVTRERVRQWHLELLPDAPRGHARQRLCRVHQQKRQLFQDSLFRAFYRDARSHFGPHRFALVPARDGFRRRLVQLDGRTIAIRAGRPASAGWKLSGAERADFIYYRLGDEGFLVIPGRALPRGGATFRAHGSPELARYRDTFAAVLSVAPVGVERSSLLERLS
jgi:hypothetical protein